MRRSKKRWYNADTIGVTISSLVLEKDINIRFSPITENFVDSIFNRFKQVEQSHRINSILNSEFSVNVTAIAKKSLTQEFTLGGKKTNPITYNINQNSLINLEARENNLCLFYATEITRQITDLTIIPNKLQRHRFRYNKTQQVYVIKELLKKLKINTDKNAYAAEKYLPILQEYYNKEYPGRYKNFFFKDSGYYKPSFITQSDRHRFICYSIMHILH